MKIYFLYNPFSSERVTIAAQTLEDAKTLIEWNDCIIEGEREAKAILIDRTYSDNAKTSDKKEMIL